LLSPDFPTLTYLLCYSGLGRFHFSPRLPHHCFAPQLPLPRLFSLFFITLFSTLVDFFPPRDAVYFLSSYVVISILLSIPPTLFAPPWPSLNFRWFFFDVILLSPFILIAPFFPSLWQGLLFRYLEHFRIVLIALFFFFPPELPFDLGLFLCGFLCSFCIVPSEPTVASYFGAPLPVPSPIVQQDSFLGPVSGWGP